MTTLTIEQKAKRIEKHINAIYPKGRAFVSATYWLSKNSVEFSVGIYENNEHLKCQYLVLSTYEDIMRLDSAALQTLIEAYN